MMVRMKASRADRKEVRPYIRLTIRAHPVKEAPSKGNSSVKSPGMRGSPAPPSPYVVADVGPQELRTLAERPDIAQIEVIGWGRYGTSRAKGSEEHRTILAIIAQNPKIQTFSG